MIMQSRLKQWLCYGLLALWLPLLSACGFHLREPSPLPFKSIYIDGKGTVILAPLKKELISKGIQITSSPAQAEVTLELINDQYTKRILTLNGDGKVREYELYYRVTYRTKLAEDATWSLPLLMESRRDFTYGDAILLSKQAEEKNLQENMHTEAMNGILRRLSALKKAQ